MPREGRESAVRFGRLARQIGQAVAVAAGVVVGVNLLGLLFSLVAPGAVRVAGKLIAAVVENLSKLTATLTIETYAYEVTNASAAALIALALLLVGGVIVWFAFSMWDELGGTLSHGFTVGIDRSPFDAGRRKFAEAAGAAGCAAILYFSAATVFIGIGLLVRAVNSITFRNANLTASAILVAIPMAAVLRPSVVKRLNWKRLGDPWLKWSPVAALSVAGFGFVGVGLKDYDVALLKSAVTYSQVPPRTLITSYIVLAAIWGLARLLWIVGSTIAGPKSDELRVPTLFFIPTFVLAWLGNLGFYTLFVNSMLLTLAAHLQLPAK